MSFADRSQPRKRDDLLPLGQPAQPPSLTEKLGGAQLELVPLDKAFKAAREAYEALKLANLANDAAAYKKAAAEMATAFTDAGAKARHFAKTVAAVLKEKKSP